MDDLLEAIIEALFEIPLEAAMESKKLKRGVKTGIVGFLGGLISAFMVCLTVMLWLDGELSSAVVMTLLTLAVLAMLIFGVIRGHKRNWKK